MGKLRLAFAMVLSSLMVLQSLLSPIAAWAEVASGQPSPSTEAVELTDQQEELDETIDDSQATDQVVSDGSSDKAEPSSAVESAPQTEASAEAVQEKTASDSADTPKSPVVGSVSYSAHVQDIGWQRLVSDGATAGTTGRSKRIEAVRVSLLSKEGEKLPANSISVQSHISGIGWESQPAGNGQTSGTTGQSRAIEALKIKLSDELSANYDIWYRVHSANFGWLGWAKNGELLVLRGMPVV